MEQCRLTSLDLTSLCLYGSMALSVILGYLWYSVVSLLQIIIVVNSVEYRALYGYDPLTKTTKRKVSNMTRPDLTNDFIENVKFYPSPDFSSNKDEKNSRKKFQPTTISMGSQSSSIENSSIVLRQSYHPNNRSYRYF